MLSFKTCVKPKCYFIPTFSIRSNGDVFYLLLEMFLRIFLSHVMSRFSDLMKFICYILGQLNMFYGAIHCLHLLLFTHALARTDIDFLACNVIEAIGQKITLSVSIWTDNWKPIKYVVELNQDDETSLGAGGGRHCV